MRAGGLAVDLVGYNQDGEGAGGAEVTKNAWAEVEVSQDSTGKAI